jgi:membrane-bound lytic murein transglycosylase D
VRKIFIPIPKILNLKSNLLALGLMSGVCAITVTSCATSPSATVAPKVLPEPVAADGSTLIPAYNPENLAEDDSAQLTEGSDLEDDVDSISELYDAEFCRDNIYGEYLKEQYLQDNATAQNPEKSFKLARHTKHHRYATRSPYNQRSIEALFFARSRMVGATVPYYGAIPVVANPRVEHWISFFKNSGRSSFLKWLVRGESVRDLVLPLLKEVGLPPEFIFLSMVESGFSNQAYSHAKATGPWQFMPGTAKIYGLEMNMFIDERRDPAKSTLAAARLLRDLYKDFGDWYLAMAAYNAGSGRVRTAIKMTGTNDFWKLADSAYLPVETKNYVPQVLAALQLSANPKGHGFDVVANPLDGMPVTTVQVKNPAHISEVAQKLGVQEKLLRHWNPELINSITPPQHNGSGPYPLRLTPVLAAKWMDVEETLEFVEVKDVLVHRIRPGDTIATIAARYRVDSKRIISLNPGLRASRLKIGTEVAVPTTTVIQKGRSTKKQASKRARGQV